MNDVVLIALISAIPPTVAALAGMAVSLHNKKTLAGVVKATNGMNAALMISEKKISFTEGETSERKAQNERDKV